MTEPIIEYVIKFSNKTAVNEKYRGKTEEIEIELEDLEIEGLDGILIDREYLLYSVNDMEFEVKERKLKM